MMVVTVKSHLCLLNHSNSKQQTLVNMLSTSYKNKSELKKQMHSELRWKCSRV